MKKQQQNPYVDYIPAEIKTRMDNGEIIELKEPVQLPLWPETARIIPNHIARCALFVPIQRGARKSYSNELLPSRSDAVIHYDGKQLDMADQDVFLQMLEYFKNLDLDEEFIIVKRSDLLKSIGKTTGKNDYKWLDESMLRLRGGLLTIETKQYKVILNMLSYYAYNKETKECKVGLHKEIKTLFSNKEFGYINWNHRRAIKNKVNLSKWLQTYISAHQKGEQNHRIDTIHKLCGSNTRINDFRGDVEEALKELVRVGEIIRLKVTKDNTSFIKK